MNLTIFTVKITMRLSSHFLNQLGINVLCNAWHSQNVDENSVVLDQSSKCIYKCKWPDENYFDPIITRETALRNYYM